MSARLTTDANTTALLPPTPLPRRWLDHWICGADGQNAWCVVFFRSAHSSGKGTFVIGYGSVNLFRVCAAVDEGISKMLQKLTKRLLPEDMVDLFLGSLIQFTHSARQSFNRKRKHPL